VLRSGAYSDEVVTNLVQRRFVACMYDVAPSNKNAGDGWAYDAEAVRTIGAIDEMPQGRRGGGTQDVDGRVRADSYPAALFLLPDGTRLGDGLWGILSPERMVRELHAVIAKWPEHFAPTDDERAVLTAAEEQPDDVAARLQAARLRWELAEFSAVLPHCADSVLARATPAERAELLWLRGRALTCLRRDAEAREALAAAATAPGVLGDAIELALARLDMRAGAHERALARLAPLADQSLPGRCSGTAMYYAGLCEHRLGRKDAARGWWRRHRTELPFDRMARRSAASLGLDESEAFLNQELLETKGWW
jgi:hypothetical protein